MDIFSILPAGIHIIIRRRKKYNLFSILYFINNIIFFVNI